METQPPSLASQLAQLHTAASAADAPCWLPDSVHALIMACLARIFGRLEQLLQLWQTGSLPQPAIRASSIRTPYVRKPSRPAARRISRRARAATRQDSLTRSAPVRHAAIAPPRVAIAITQPPPRRCRRPARDPPPTCQSRPFARILKHVYIVTIS